MKTATQEIGDLEIETREMERRVNALRVEVTNLEKRKASFIEEANGIKLSVEANATKRLQEGRQETARITEERQRLDADKAEYSSELKVFSQEKVVVQKMKEDAQNAIDNYKKMYGKLARFIIMVKRESELL